MHLLKYLDMIQEKGLYIPNPKLVRAVLSRRPKQNVAVMLHRGKNLLNVILGENIVTDEGDRFYAEKACGQSPLHAFQDIYLASAGPGTPGKTDVRSAFTDISGSNKTKSGSYPMTSDTDGDNTGSGVDVISWLFSYAAGDGNWTGITHAYVTVNGPAAGEHLLCSIKFAASWNKDSSTSAKVFVNHTENGV